MDPNRAIEIVYLNNNNNNNNSKKKKDKKQKAGDGRTESA